MFHLSLYFQIFLQGSTIFIWKEKLPFPKSPKVKSDLFHWGIQSPGVHQWPRLGRDLWQLNGEAEGPTLNCSPKSSAICFAYSTGLLHNISIKGKFPLLKKKKKFENFYHENNTWVKFRVQRIIHSFKHEQFPHRKLYILWEKNRSFNNIHQWLQSKLGYHGPEEEWRQKGKELLLWGPSKSRAWGQEKCMGSHSRKETQIITTEWFFCFLEKTKGRKCLDWLVVKYQDFTDSWSELHPWTCHLNPMRAQPVAYSPWNSLPSLVCKTDLRTQCG